MVVRNILSLVACVCLVGALACKGKSSPSASSVPVITSFSPDSAPTGATVTLTGTGFNGAGNVSVGGAQATFSIKSDNVITLTVPSNALTGMIAIVNLLGTGGTGTAFYVTPTVTAISPTSGSPGTVVVLTGTGFTGAQKVVFGAGGDPANFIVNSANQAQAVVPLKSFTGPVTITVPAVSGTTTASSATFTYSSGGVTPPVLTGFSPTQAVTGAQVAVTGSGFTGVSGVTLGGVSAFFTVTDDTHMSVQVPAAAATGLVQLLGPLGNAASTGTFTVIPSISGFSPAAGPAQTLVTVKGTGFMGATSVAFGNATLSNFLVVDANTLLANVATGSASGVVTLASSGLTCQSTGSFTFLPDPLGAPAITSISTTQAVVGASVTLTGTGFTGVTKVTVGGAEAAFTVDSDTGITLTVPNDAASGFIAAENDLGVASSAATFIVTPSITGLSVAQGPVGTSVTITGTGFRGTSMVAFGGGSPANFAVLDANHVTAQVNADASTGPVQLTASGVACQSAGDFTVTVP